MKIESQFIYSIMIYWCKVMNSFTSRETLQKSTFKTW